MVKGKHWTPKKEQQLRELVAAKKTVNFIADVMEKSEESVRMKIRRLGLNVVERPKNHWSTTNLKIPQVLPSIETALKKLVAAMEALETPGLSKTEVVRLRAIIHAVSIYQVKVSLNTWIIEELNRNYLS